MKINVLILLGLMLILNTSCGDDEIRGCMNPNATNYNPEATETDGSCIILGCTDATASNYNPAATESDGTCTFTGCTDPMASNYNPMATDDDGSCLYSGCTDVNSDQYDNTANDNDGSCETYFDRWSNTYAGDFICEGALLNQFFGDATMTFSESNLDDNKDSVDVFIQFSLSEFPLNFKAAITRDSLYANAFFPNYQLPEDIDIVPNTDDEAFDVTISGVLGISENNENVQGILTVFLEEVGLGLDLTYDDSCTFTGVKQ